MGMPLPEPLEWVAAKLGVKWPDSDETELGHTGLQFMRAARAFEGHREHVHSTTNEMLAANQSVGLDAFKGFNLRLSSPAGSHMMISATTAMIIGQAYLSASATVLIAKIRVLALLIEAFTTFALEAQLIAAGASTYAYEIERFRRRASALADAITEAITIAIKAVDKVLQVAARVIEYYEKPATVVLKARPTDRDRAQEEARQGPGRERADIEKWWTNPASLADHFSRHGGDFAAANPNDYARMANDFYMRGTVQKLPTKISTDGTVRIYDPATNTFGAYTATGQAKTYFRPTSPTYWERQPGKLVR